MAEQKDIPVHEVPPPYPTAAPTKNNKTKTKLVWGLMFYAGATTAALVTVSVFASLYGFNERMRGDDTENVKRYHTNYNSTEEDIDIDVNRDREIIKQIESDGNVSTVVLDFKKNFGGVYNAKYGMCMFLRDFEDTLPHAKDYSYFLDHSGFDVAGEPTEEFKYEVDEAQAVDLANLPPELVEPCWGKPVYGLRLKNEGDQGGRNKRCWIKVTVLVRIRLCVWCKCWYITVQKSKCLFG